MVSVIKKNGYHYLDHSYRKDGKSSHIERYLGKTLPNQEELFKIREEFNYEIFEKLWLEKVEKITKKLDNTNFVERAPKDVVAQSRLKAEDLKAQLVTIEENLRQLET